MCLKHVCATVNSVCHDQKAQIDITRNDTRNFTRI